MVGNGFRLYAADISLGLYSVVLEIEFLKMFFNFAGKNTFMTQGMECNVESAKAREKVNKSK